MAKLYIYRLRCGSALGRWFKAEETALEELMNITLSQKDADFILRFLRTDLEHVTKCGDYIRKKQADVKSHLKDLEGPEQILIGGLLEVSDDMICESEELKSELLKCIELLTVGSEDLNGVA